MSHAEEAMEVQSATEPKEKPASADAEMDNTTDDDVATKQNGAGEAGQEPKTENGSMHEAEKEEEKMEESPAEDAKQT
ncbi:hypothetical protein AAVH_36465, partial [Aphelenchoides avenae]